MLELIEEYPLMNAKLLGVSAVALMALAGAVKADVMEAGDGQYCREYTQTMTIAGKTQKGFGTACLQPDGSWKLETPVNGAAVQPMEEDADGTYEADDENINYVVQDQQVVVVPSEPFVYGDVWLGGGVHHFGRGYRPGGGWHGGGHGGGWHH